MCTSWLQPLSGSENKGFSTHTHLSPKGQKSSRQLLSPSRIEGLVHSTTACLNGPTFPERLSANAAPPIIAELITQK